jgi:ketosteroid isomerase-like protein
MIARVSATFVITLAVAAGEPTAHRVPRNSSGLRVARAELLAADRAFAARSTTTTLSNGIVGMLADHVTFVARGKGRLTTPGAVRDFLDSDSANTGARLTWTPLRADVSADGTRGYTYGYATATLANGNEVPGKYLAYWRREPDGEWRVAAYKRVPREPGVVSTVLPPGFEMPSADHYPSFVSAPASLQNVVMANDREFAGLALRSGVGAAFRKYAARDAVGLFDSKGFTFGPEAIAASFGDVKPGEFFWRPVFADVAPSGDLAVISGDVEIREVAADGSFTVQATAVYLTIWRRQPNGDWRFVADS